MAKLINKSKLTTFTNKFWDKIISSFVSKTLPNNVIGETVFSDGHIEGAMLNHFNNKNPQMLIGNNAGDCFGVPNNSVNAGIHVGRIALAVNPSLTPGSTVRNVTALAVKKSNNEVLEVIVQDGEGIVYNNQYNNITADKIIYIDINKKFSEEVYFVIGCNGLLWNTDTPPRANVYGSSTIPAVGDRLTIADYGYSGRFITFAGKTSFEELVGARNDSVSKTNDNILSGTTVLQNGYIDGELYSYNNSNIVGAANGNSIYSGTNNKIIHSNQHVTSIVIAVNNDFPLGSTVTGVNIGVVRNSNNQVMEYIMQNGTATVVENNYPQRITATRVINVPVDKKWTEDIYLLVGANGMLWGEARNTPGITTATGGNSLPSVGSTIRNLNRTNYIGRVVTLGSKINLNSLTNKVDASDVGNEANKIPRVLPNGKLDPSILPPEQNGGVRTVNGQSPVNGNVAVLADHIKYANGQNTTVKEAIDNKVNVSDTVTSSQAGKIVKLDDSGKINNNMLPSSIIKSNQDNNFTKHNNFNDYSPTVHRLFTRKHINSNAAGSTEAYPVNTYFAILNEKYTENNKQISHILIPIKNAQVGDNLDISFFTFNNNNQVNYIESYTRTCPVIDEEILGHKCAKIQVNRSSGTSGIGFGFMNMTHSINGRQLGIACIRNTSGGNKIWSQTHSPRDGQTLSANANATISYKICYETTSEVVTRFELENVTQMYPRMVGELKQLAYDCGDSFKDGTNTWLRANGQSINSNDYLELYEKFNTSRTDDDIEVSVPDIENQVGYYYICAK